MAAVIRIQIESSGGAAEVKGELQDLSKTAEESGGGFSALKEIGVGALRAIGEAGIGLAVQGFQAVAGAISDGIEDAKQNAQIQAQTAAVLKSTGNAAGVSAEHIADYASALSDAAGTSLFGDDQIQQSTNLLLTFTNIKGATLDAATAISVDMAQALGGAPKDAAIQLGKALNDPIKGVTALTRVGVTFSDEQKAQIQAMQEAGDTAGAQAIILAELNKEFGGSAQAAADATGGWSEFNGRMGEAKEALGAAVLPLLNMLAGVLNDTVLPVVEQAAAAFGAWLADPAVQAGIQQVVDLVVSGLGAALTFISTVVIPALIAAWNLIQPAIAVVLAALTQGGDGANQFGAIWTILQATVTNVVNAISAVVMAVFGVVQAFIAAHGEEIAAFMTEAWNQIMAIVKVGIQLYNAIVPPILNAIAGFIRNHGETIQRILTNVWDVIKAVITAALAIIKGVLTAALQVIQGDWSGAWETVKSTLSTVWSSITAILSAAWDTIKALFGGFATQALDFGKNIIQGIIDGISNGVGALTNAVANAAQNALDAAKDALGISSPSTVFALQVGQPMAQGMAAGLLGGAPLVARAAQSVSGGAVSSATTTVHNTLNFQPRYSSGNTERLDFNFAKSLAGVI